MWILRSTPDSEGSPLVVRLLAGGSRTIGRVGIADFVVDVPRVSRVHCRLTATVEGQLFVEDLSSTNGTFVNGEQVSRAGLDEGDRLRVGGLELAVERLTDDDQAGDGLPDSTTGQPARRLQ